MSEPEIVVGFPARQFTEDEQLRLLKAEAERLANQSEIERNFFMEKRAERIGIRLATLRAAVNAVLKERAERFAAERLQQERQRAKEEKQRAAEEHEQQRAKQQEEKRWRQAEKQAEQEKQRAEREAERKRKGKAKGFANILRLPVARHEGELAKLAKRLNEDIAALREEFHEFAGVAEGMSTPADWDVEPWLEPVNLAKLLGNIEAKIAKHVVLQPFQRVAVTLWVSQAWVHNEIATYSPILTPTSAEADSGKTTLLGTVAQLVPRPSLNVESTGPTVYRYVDAHKPTLIIDEADDLFVRKSDLKHVINTSWTRGTKIPRQVNIGGISTTVLFDPFCPKCLGLIGRNLPRTMRTRAIEIRMQPKRPDEKVEPFRHTDDTEFAVLRRKLARFAIDNVAALKNATPTMPSSLNNRAGMNWHLLLAIAALAGGTWPQRAREAAERLSRSGRRPSDGVQLLAAFKEIFADGRKMVTSEDVVKILCKDATAIWVVYNRGGPVTQRQVAWLLEQYEIESKPLHPTRRANFGRMGYEASQFSDAFARYLPADAIIQSSGLNRTTVKAAHREDGEAAQGEKAAMIE